MLQAQIDNADILARGNLSTWPVAMILNRTKVLQLKMYWRHGLEGAKMLIFKDTTSSRSTRLSMFSKDLSAIEFGDWNSFDLQLDQKKAQYRNVVPMKLYHTSKHVKHGDSFVFLFDGVDDVLDFTYHAMMNLGTKLRILNPSFYRQFDLTKSKHSRHAKPDGKHIKTSDVTNSASSPLNVKVLNSSQKSFSGDDDTSSSKLPEKGSRGGFKF